MISAAHLIDRLHRAHLRERVLLFLALVFLSATVWYQLVMAPLLVRRIHVVAALGDASQKLGFGTDPESEALAVLKTRELGLKQAIAKVDDSLRGAQSGLIEPKRMIAVLKEILDRQHGLTLVRIRNLPVRSLQPAAMPASDATQIPELGPGPYLHPVEIDLRGNYLDVLAYLQALESMPWGVQWQRFELDTDQAGLRYRVELATLSMESNWLGV